MANSGIYIQSRLPLSVLNFQDHQKTIYEAACILHLSVHICNQNKVELFRDGYINKVDIRAYLQQQIFRLSAAASRQFSVQSK